MTTDGKGVSTGGNRWTLFLNANNSKGPVAFFTPYFWSRAALKDPRLGDGSALTYYWYRFADQPALLNADLTDVERERMQQRMEKIQRAWPKNDN